MSPKYAEKLVKVFERVKSALGGSQNFPNDQKMRWAACEIISRQLHASYSRFLKRKYPAIIFCMIPRETINKAIDYILLHLTTQISVDDVAAFCGWSKFYFCREFKRHTGQSVHSFIRRMRLEQITMKLKTSGRTISDTCLNGCKYCYANKNPQKAHENFKFHNPESPILLGEIKPADTIIRGNQQSFLEKEFLQGELF